MECTLDYANFRAWVPRNVLPVGNLNPHDWVYYDWGPRKYAEPLLCLHPVIGSAESFHLQVLRLSERGYRVITPQLPVCWTAPEFCDGLLMFLDMLHIRRVHLYGCGLGGFLALHFSARRPERVASIALTHAFLSTESLDHRLVYSPSVLRWLPDFLVRNAVQSLFPKGRAEIRVAEAAEFAIARTLDSSRDELASRLALLVTKSSVVGRLRVPEEFITIIDVFGLPSSQTVQAGLESATALPRARRAMLKSGGDFPYLSVADDVTLHLVVHLRRNAPPPAQPLPQPPPARPKPLSLVRRKHPSSPIMSDPDEDDAGASKTDALAALKQKAEERVRRLENERLELYSSHVASLREGGIDMDDAILCAIVEDCVGDVETALERIRDGHYSDGFYDELRRCALEEALKDLQFDGKELGGDSVGDNSVVASADPAECRSHESTDPGPRTDSGKSEVTFSSLKSGDPLRVVTLAAPTSVEPDLEKRATATTRRDSSPGAPGSDHPLIGVPTGVDDSVGLPEHPLAVRGIDERRSMDSSEDAYSHKSAGKKRAGKMMRSSRDRYPPETDSVSAYVTSERVGMRSEGKLIGRGPTPINNPGYSLGSSPRPVSRGDNELSLQRSRSIDRGVQSSGFADVWGPSISGTPRSEAVEDDLFLSVDSAPASQPGDIGVTAPNRRGSDVDALLGGSQSFDGAVGDGWDDFRRRGHSARLLSSDLHVERVISSETNASGRLTDTVDEGDRLREWVMSAQSATETVRRKQDRP